MLPPKALGGDDLLASSWIVVPPSHPGIPWLVAAITPLFASLCVSHLLLMRTRVTGLRAHLNLVWPHLT